MTNIKPVGQKLLVKRVSSEEKLDSGIVLPDVSSSGIEKGIIVSVSEELLSKDVCPYNEGEVVLYQGGKGVAILYNRESHVLIDGGNGLEQGDVLAIIKP